MRTIIVISCALSLAGCASAVNPSKLEGPAKVLMMPPKALPELKAGDDLVQRHADLRRQYSTETDKLRRLQRWVKTVLQK